MDEGALIKIHSSKECVGPSFTAADNCTHLRAKHLQFFLCQFNSKVNKKTFLSPFAHRNYSAHLANKRKVIFHGGFSSRTPCVWSHKQSDSGDTYTARFV